MPVATQGFPPWPPCTQDQWPAWTGFTSGGLLLGPPAPVPMNAGGPGITIIPQWDYLDQCAIWVTEEPVPEPEPEEPTS